MGSSPPSPATQQAREAPPSVAPATWAAAPEGCRGWDLNMEKRKSQRVQGF